MGEASGFDVDSVDHVLTTTRAVRRRLDLDRAVPDEVIAECLRIAVQAPNGANTQMWRFVVVTDIDKRTRLAEIYRRLLGPYTEIAGRVFGPDAKAAYEEPGTMMLAENLHRVPVHVIPCTAYRAETMTSAFNSAGGELTIPDEFAQGGVYASLYPAVWSLMLALRARGLGSSLTTLHVLAADDVAEVIDMPSSVTLGGLIPVAYFTGTDFRPGIRRPAEEVTYWDTWGSTRQAGEAR